MLIALSAGTSAERRKVADLLIQESAGRLVLHAQVTPGIPCRGPRAAPSAVVALAQQRAALLTEVLNGRRRSGLILVHCLTEPEARVVRARGGCIWHIYGEPSKHVPIHNQDPIVSMSSHAPTHVVEPLEAYSQQVLRQREKRSRDRQ